MATLSVVINTCEEAHLLADCVASARQCADEVVVCDMESSDGAEELARSLGCICLRHPRRPAPEPEARVAAIEAATGDWVLVLDPDMRVPIATAGRIRQVVDRDEADMVDFHCRHNYFGRWCTRGHGAQPVYRKLFKKAAFTPVSRNIQTFWHDSLRGRRLVLPRAFSLEHLAWPSVDACVRTHVRYARCEAEQALAAGIEPCAGRMLWRPLKRFLGNYFLRRGCLDGMPGLIVSVIVSCYLFLLEAELWDLHRRRADATGAGDD